MTIKVQAITSQPCTYTSRDTRLTFYSCVLTTRIANFTKGNVLLRKGDQDQAFQLHTLALTARRDSLGDTYRTAASMHKVAWFLHNRKDDQGAQ